MAGSLIGIELADIGVAVTIVGGLVALFYLLRVVQAQNASAQIAAKDAVIHTHEQAESANERRITALEEQVAILSGRLSEAHTEIRSLQDQLADVKRYAAPEAVKRFEKTQAQIIEILQAIQGEISR